MFDNGLDVLGSIDENMDIVYIGRQAFRNPQTLAAVIGHERMHIWFRNRVPDRDERFARRPEDEAGAYLWQMFFSKKLGLTADDEKWLQLWPQYVSYVSKAAQCPSTADFHFPGPNSP